LPAEADVEFTEGLGIHDRRLPMNVEERVAQFLTANKGRAYRDDCLADEVGINRHQARNATSGLAASGRFYRDSGLCSSRTHDRDKKVIWA